MGLYLAHDVGDRHYYDDGVKLAPLFNPDDHGLVGANLDFKGFRFVIWLGGDELTTFNIPQRTVESLDLPAPSSCIIRETLDSV